MKKEFIILSVLIIVICTYLVVHNSDKVNYSLPDIPEISISKISAIEIITSDSSLLLKKRDNNWYINSENYLADINSINLLTGFIKKLELTALISESKNFDLYGLSDNKKITVKVMEDSDLKLKFDIGKKASSLQHTFIRLDKDKRVYHANGNLRDEFDKTVDDLRDKKILLFDKTKISMISLENNDKKITLLRKEVPEETALNGKKDKTNSKPEKTKIIWQTDDGKEYDTVKANALINRIYNLKCASFIYNSKKEDYKEPLYTITVKDVKEHRLSFFPGVDEAAKGYPATSSDSDYSFLLSKYLAEDIMIDIE